MRVIYDISVLGTSFYHHRARTGIARVVENIALQLTAQQYPVDLRFCGYYTTIQLVQVLKYLEAMPALRKEYLILTANPILNSIIRSSKHVYPGPSRNFLFWLLRRTFAILLGRGMPVNTSIELSALKAADIFHATFYPIPEFVRSSRTIRKFITVYDLIPILYPQYFSFKEDHLLHDVMKSITPEDWVITISESTKNDLCDYLHFDPKRVFITHLAASDQFYRCEDRNEFDRVRRTYGIPEGPYILSLSTLEPRKNIDHTIRCFARLVQEQHIPDLNLVLVGTHGWDFDGIFRELSNHLALRNRIIVTGYIADEDLAAIYSGAQMFVYPSFYEGFGLPPLEAMQCGVPVITSNTSSMPEVVGDAGRMVDPNDGDALCQAMYDIYRQPTYREALSGKSLARAAIFSWGKCASETLGAYQTALRSSS